ncbi:MAG: hypothetical protein ABI401_13385 [Candidatus Dormibacter sp.]
MKGESSESAAIDAAVKVVAHLMAEAERSAHLKILIILAGKELRYEVSRSRKVDGGAGLYDTPSLQRS